MTNARFVAAIAAYLESGIVLLDATAAFDLAEAEVTKVAEEEFGGEQADIGRLRDMVREATERLQLKSDNPLVVALEDAFALWFEADALMAEVPGQQRGHVGPWTAPADKPLL